MKEERKFESKVEITNITQEIIKTETSYIPFEQNEPRKRIPKEKCQKISKWLTTMGENMKKKRKTMTVEDLEDFFSNYFQCFKEINSEIEQISNSRSKLLEKVFEGTKNLMRIFFQIHLKEVDKLATKRDELQCINVDLDRDLEELRAKVGRYFQLHHFEDTETRKRIENLLVPSKFKNISSIILSEAAKHEHIEANTSSMPNNVFDMKTLLDGYQTSNAKRTLLNLYDEMMISKKNKAVLSVKSEDIKEFNMAAFEEEMYKQVTEIQKSAAIKFFKLYKNKQGLVEMETQTDENEDLKTKQIVAQLKKNLRSKEKELVRLKKGSEGYVTQQIRDREDVSDLRNKIVLITKLCRATGEQLLAYKQSLLEIKNCFENIWAESPQNSKDKTDANNDQIISLGKAIKLSLEKAELREEVKFGVAGLEEDLAAIEGLDSQEEDALSPIYDPAKAAQESKEPIEMIHQEESINSTLIKSKKKPKRKNSPEQRNKIEKVEKTKSIDRISTDSNKRKYQKHYDILNERLSRYTIDFSNQGTKEFMSRGVQTRKKRKKSTKKGREKSLNVRKDKQTQTEIRDDLAEMEYFELKEYLNSMGDRNSYNNLQSSILPQQNLSMPINIPSIGDRRRSSEWEIVPQRIPEVLKRSRKLSRQRSMTASHPDSSLGIIGKVSPIHMIARGKMSHSPEQNIQRPLTSTMSRLSISHEGEVKEKTEGEKVGDIFQGPLSSEGVDLVIRGMKQQKIEHPEEDEGAERLLKSMSEEILEEEEKRERVKQILRRYESEEGEHYTNESRNQYSSWEDGRGKAAPRRKYKEYLGIQQMHVSIDHKARIHELQKGINGECLPKETVPRALIHPIPLPTGELGVLGVEPQEEKRPRFPPHIRRSKGRGDLPQGGMNIVEFRSKAPRSSDRDITNITNITNISNISNMWKENTNDTSIPRIKRTMTSVDLLPPIKYGKRIKTVAAKKTTNSSVTAALNTKTISMAKEYFRNLSQAMPPSNQKRRQEMKDSHGEGYNMGSYTDRSLPSRSPPQEAQPIRGLRYSKGANFKGSYFHNVSGEPISIGGQRIPKGYQPNSKIHHIHPFGNTINKNPLDHTKGLPVKRQRARSSLDTLKALGGTEETVILNEFHVFDTQIVKTNGTQVVNIADVHVDNKSKYISTIAKQQ